MHMLARFPAALDSPGDPAYCRPVIVNPAIVGPCPTRTESGVAAEGLSPAT